MQYTAISKQRLLFSIYLLSFTLLSHHALAVDIGSLAYTLDSPGTGEATVTGPAGVTSYIIVIPASIVSGSTTYSVTNIGNNAFFDRSLTSVTIPGSVTRIGDNAFANNKLTSLTIPNSVTSVGSDAFIENDLVSVVIPNSVTSIGDRAFLGNALVSVAIPDSVTVIGDSTFKSNSLSSVTIPNSVTSIGDNAFAFNQIASITIPNSVTSIGIDAFSVNSLTSVTIPATVTTMQAGAFQSNFLTSVSFLGSYNANFNSTIFDQSPGLTSISAYCSGSGWGGISFTNGTSLVAVTESVSCLPGAPTHIVGIPGNAQARIAFLAGADNGAAITNYQYSLDGVNYTALSPPVSSSPVTIPGLANGNNYSITLKALNSVGDGIASVAVAVTPVAPAPPPPPPPPPADFDGDGISDEQEVETLYDDIKVLENIIETLDVSSSSNQKQDLSKKLKSATQSIIELVAAGVLEDDEKLDLLNTMNSGLKSLNATGLKDLDQSTLGEVFTNIGVIISTFDESKCAPCTDEGKSIDETNALLNTLSASLSPDSNPDLSDEELDDNKRTLAELDKVRTALSSKKISLCGSANYSQYYLQEEASRAQSSPPRRTGEAYLGGGYSSLLTILLLTAYGGNSSCGGGLGGGSGRSDNSLLLPLLLLGDDADNDDSLLLLLVLGGGLGGNNNCQRRPQGNRGLQTNLSCLPSRPSRSNANSLRTISPLIDDSISIADAINNTLATSFSNYDSLSFDEEGASELNFGDLLFKVAISSINMQVEAPPQT